MAWITPKTNWAKTDKFTIADYNRIKNNLLHINDMLNQMFPQKAKSLDLGNDVTYSDRYLPSQFNAFEEALESFTRVGSDVNIGEKKVFYGNAPFIDYQELNRIENCSLRWYNFEPPITRAITIKPDAKILILGESATFEVSTTPANAEDRNTYTVTSSDTSVVTVTKNGMKFTATSVGEGDATITVSIGSVSATVNVQVQAPQVTQIICSEKSITLNRSESRTIDLTFLPEDALNKKNWTVTTNNSNVSVLRINDNQIKITGNTAGSQSVVTISCGEVFQKILVSIEDGLNDVWVGGKDQMEYRSYSFHINGGISDTDGLIAWVRTNPMQALIDNNYNFTISFGDDSMCKCWYAKDLEWLRESYGDNAILLVPTTKKSHYYEETTMTVTFLDLSRTHIIYVRKK